MKTLNKAVARYNGISLIVRILVGLIIGAVLALVAPGAGWVGELGSLFVGALKGIAPVLVFVIVASALAQGSSKLDRRFGTVIWLYMLTTFLAAAIAVVTSFMFPVTVVLADAAQSDVVPQGLGEVMGTLLTNFVACSCTVSSMKSFEKSSFSFSWSILSRIIALFLLLRIYSKELLYKDLYKYPINSRPEANRISECQRFTSKSCTMSLEQSISFTIDSTYTHIAA